MEIRENLPLAPFTTLDVGGPARFFMEVHTTAEVRESLDFARSRDVPLFVLGGGSNLLISDAGWRGLVLKIAISGINHRHGRGTAYFDVGAGEVWDDFVAMAVQHNCAGIECLSGIPGSVGGTPVQNVGAYGQEVAETIFGLTAIDLETGKDEEFEKDDCGFAYRSSIFNTSRKGRYLITNVTFALVHDGEPQIRYGDLQKYFASSSGSRKDGKPTVAEVREAVRKIRASKAMLITPGDEDSRSAGSFFKNPVLPAADFDALKKKRWRAAWKFPAIRRSRRSEKFPQRGWWSIRDSSRDTPKDAWGFRASMRSPL